MISVYNLIWHDMSIWRDRTTWRDHMIWLLSDISLIFSISFVIHIVPVLCACACVVFVISHHSSASPICRFMVNGDGDCKARAGAVGGVGNTNHIEHIHYVIIMSHWNTRTLKTYTNIETHTNGTKTCQHILGITDHVP